MFTSQDTQTALEPVLQVLSAKPVSSQQGAGRWRLILSDGQHFAQGMLGTNLNHLVQGDTPDVYRNTVIKLTGYAVNHVQNRKVIIILNLDVVSQEPAKLGEPVTIENALSLLVDGGAAAGAATAAGTSYDSSGQPINDAVSAAPARPAPANNNNNGGGAAGRGGSNASRTSAAKRGGNQAQQGGLAAQPLFMIDALTPYSNKSVLAHFQNLESFEPSLITPRCAGGPSRPASRKSPTFATGPITRATDNSSASTCSTSRCVIPSTSYKAFRPSSDTAGTESSELQGEIRATGFNKEVDRLYPILEEGKVYRISRARVNIAKKQFSNLSNEYELMFGQETEVEPVDEVRPRFSGRYSCHARTSRGRELISITSLPRCAHSRRTRACPRSSSTLCNSPTSLGKKRTRRAT